MSVVNNSPESEQEPRRKTLSQRLRSKGLLRWAGLGAAMLYFIITLLFGSNQVGLHYDEAIIQHGAVQMLNSASEPTFAHDSGSWVKFAGRHWPLAIIPYA